MVRVGVGVSGDGLSGITLRELFCLIIVDIEILVLLIFLGRCLTRCAREHPDDDLQFERCQVRCYQRYLGLIAVLVAFTQALCSLILA